MEEIILPFTFGIIYFFTHKEFKIFYLINLEL